MVRGVVAQRGLLCFGEADVLVLAQLRDLLVVHGAQTGDRSGDLDARERDQRADLRPGEISRD